MIAFHDNGRVLGLYTSENAIPPDQPGLRVDGVRREWLAQVRDDLRLVRVAPNARDVDAERNRRLLAFTFEGQVFDFIDGKGSDANIAGAATLALAALVAGAKAGDVRWANPAVDFAWIANDNSLRAMDAPTVLAFGRTAAAWKAAHIFAARALKDADPIPADYDADAYWPLA